MLEGLSKDDDTSYSKLIDLLLKVLTVRLVALLVEKILRH